MSFFEWSKQESVLDLSPDLDSHDHQSGFTLLEMLAAIAIVAIVASLAIPGLQSLVSNSQLSARHNAITDALQLRFEQAGARR